MHTYTNLLTTRGGKHKLQRKPAASVERVLPAHFSLVQRKTNCSCGGDCPSCRSGLALQPKLNISSPNDRYEREADKVASQIVGAGATNPEISRLEQTPYLHRLSVNESPTEEDAMSIPGNGSALPDKDDAQVQRMAENVQDEEEQEDPAIQRLKIVGLTNGARQVTQQAFSRRLASTQNQGQPLNPAQQRFMESRFKRDFSQVRIHNDAQAKHLSSDIQARAFTFANHIYFNQGEYQPETLSGKNVLAHELTHVVQQGAASAKGVNAQRNVTKPTLSHSRSAERHHKVNRMSTLGSGDSPVTTGVRPWRNTAHPIGSNYKVQTDGGSTVMGWVAYSPYQNNLRYWCHGYTLGTYQNNALGYSVYSGTPLKTVVKDEWKPIPASNTQPGDIAVWTQYQHSAKFTSVSKLSGGGLDENASRLNSKNGQAALDNYTLSKLIAVKPYGPRYRVYRHK
jgi:hypothetical protein